MQRHRWYQAACGGYVRTCGQSTITVMPMQDWRLRIGYAWGGRAFGEENQGSPSSTVVEEAEVLSTAALPRHAAVANE